MKVRKYNMKIKTLKLGELNTNCYILTNNDKCLIIDPASDAKLIMKECESYDVLGILVTHHHFDHILALQELERYYNLKHNDHTSNSFNYEVIKTPGHTSDSLTFYFKNEGVMFTGDFLFYGTIGRCDFETSNIKEMQMSLLKIKEYPNDIVIYPGHGRSSILGTEKNNFSIYLN